LLEDFSWVFLPVANSGRDNIFVGEIFLSIQSTILGLVNQLYLACLVIWHELCSWWRGLGFDFLFRKVNLELEDDGLDVISLLYDGF
jgi:hypothetical protein